jgi:uncharacterized membrane protein HdeD (DUF308 family)
MSVEKGQTSGVCCAGECEQLKREFQHLRSRWCWLFLFGLLLAVCGTAAIVFPLATAATSMIAVIALAVALMVAGMATIVTSVWVGKWSGMLVQMLVGILYLVVGFMVVEHPLKSLVALTLFVAALFIVVGIFRTVAALLIRFPNWGWALLNGLLTFLLGMVIYRHFPQAALWVAGLLVGVEMLFHGWTWIMLSLAIRKIPADAA